MTADKNPSIFSRQMEAIVFIILQIILQYEVLKKWGISLGYSPVLAGACSVT